MTQGDQIQSFVTPRWGDGVGWGGKKEGILRQRGCNVSLWLIHVDIWQKPTQYC